jgi:hypothetical protein
LATGSRACRECARIRIAAHKEKARGKSR